MAASRRHAWDGKIEGLPAEILSYDIKEVPLTTLKDMASRLNADSICTGNWESLAEKLGFPQNSMVCNLAQQARVQNTYPGLLMLQEWSLRCGSTAHVLLHALREIQREDCLSVLVNKLFELSTMSLSVSVQDDKGPAKFLRVATQKSAPLHASLDNTLQKPPYWYDIVGPRYDINWNTPSGDLQGTQLSLRVRVTPSEHSMSDIYGTSARLCQPPLSIPLGMNIPPEQPEQDPVFQEGNGTSLWNELSSPRHDGMSQSPTRMCIAPKASTAVSVSSAVHDRSPNSALCSFQPLTSTGIPARSEHQQQFPNFNTLMSSTLDFHFSAPPVNVSSLLNSADNMEYHPCSQTGLKEPVVLRRPGEHDETALKAAAKPGHEKMNIVATVDKAEDQTTGAMEHDERALSETVQLANTSRSPVAATSTMHSLYISHEKMIQFCNNPTSPQSLGSNPSSLSSTEGTFVKPRFALELQSTDPCAAVQQASVSPDGFKRMVSPGDYVHVQFTEQPSPASDKTPQVSSGLNEEENMQTECSESEYVTAEGLNPSGNNFYQQERDTYRQLTAVASTSAGYSNMDGGSSSSSTSSKPTPCTYTMYRPGEADSGQQYAVSSPPRPVPHSVSLDSNQGGYLDMRACQAGASNHPHPHPQHPAGTTAAAMLAGIHSSMSMDSYMNTHMPPSPEDYVSADSLLDSTGSNLSSPHRQFGSRSRNPLPAGAGDMFPPRDRRPLTQDQELLLDDPEPEYTYIDAASVATAASPQVPRRASEGAASGPGSGADRSGMYRNSSDSAVQRRSSGVKLDNRGSVCSAELDQVAGWNARITERTVEDEMSRYINDDGNFVVWRYTVGGKYVISVSHLRSLRHYAVYESEREGKVTYYIFPKGSRFTSLTGLVLHCQKHGVAEPTKTFKTPDGKQAHQSSGSSGRFSHVRLKFPIPARRH